MVLHSDQLSSALVPRCGPLDAGLDHLLHCWKTIASDSLDTLKASIRRTCELHLKFKTYFGIEFRLDVLLSFVLEAYVSLFG